MKRPRMSHEAAVRLVQENRVYGLAAHTLFALFDNRGWDVLGYMSWDEFVRKELTVGLLDQLNENERESLAISLRSHGMSLRGIASMTGWSHTTVQSRTEGKADESDEFAGRVLHNVQEARRLIMSLETLAIHPEFQNIKHLIGDDVARELTAIQGALQNVALSNT